MGFTRSWHTRCFCRQESKNVIAGCPSLVQRGGLNKFWNKQFLFVFDSLCEAFFSDVGFCFSLA